MIAWASQSLLWCNFTCLYLCFQVCERENQEATLAANPEDTCTVHTPVWAETFSLSVGVRMSGDSASRALAACTVSSMSDSKYVKLNVGGTLHLTTIDTLCKQDTMLRAMFSGRMDVLHDKEGMYLYRSEIWSWLASKCPKARGVISGGPWMLTEIFVFTFNNLLTKFEKSNFWYIPLVINCDDRWIRFNTSVNR